MNWRSDLGRLGTALLFLLALLAWPVAVRAEPLTADQAAALNRLLAQQHKATSIPGIALVIRRDGAVVYRGAIGIDGNGRPFSPSTPVWLGSLSKSFTAMAIMQLVAAHKVDLDQPVVRYLPDFKMGDPRGAGITVRNLMEHRSGLTDANLPDWTHPWPDTYAEATRRVHQVNELSSAPGTRIAYHNANYMLLADLVERVSGESFEHYLSAHVFASLGLSSAMAFAHLDATPAGVPPGYVFVLGYPLALHPAGMFVGGAGGVIANADDLSLWIEAFAASARHPDDDRLLPRGMLASLLKPQSRAGYVYAYGWVLRQPGTSLIRHDGGLPTFVTHAAFAPDDSLNIAVTTNGSQANAAWSQAGQDIADGAVEILANRPVTTIPPTAIGKWVELGVLTFTCLTAALVPVIARPRRWRDRARAMSQGRKCWLWLRASIVPLLVVCAVLVGLPALVGMFESWSWFWLWYLSPIVTTCLWALALEGITILLWRWRAMLRSSPEANAE